MDIIFISDLRLDLLIGVYDWEQQAAQPVEFNIEIGMVPRATGAPVVLEDTIDYAQVVARIRDSTQGRHFPLLEQLAEQVAGMVLDEFGAPWVKVSVAKLAPLKGVRRLGVSIERKTQTRS